MLPTDGETIAYGNSFASRARLSLSQSVCRRSNACVRQLGIRSSMALQSIPPCSSGAARLRVLVVEDAADVRLVLRRCFESDGYVVEEAADAAAARQALSEQSFDLVTLDLQIPGENGLALARDLRATSDVPLMMVTGRGDLVDRVAGLEVGADDYVTKPFHMREVQARARSILRRTRSRPSIDASRPAPTRPRDMLAFDRWVIDLDRRELTTRDGHARDLTASEFELLSVFLKHPNRVLSRQRIMDLLKGVDWSPFDRAIDTQVRRLRQKIEDDPSAPRLVKTVRGAGYLFAETPRATSADDRQAGANESGF